jgi:sortase A
MKAVRIFKKFLSLVLISISIVFLSLGAYQVWLKYDPNRLSFSNYTVSADEVPANTNIPVNITMPTIGINLHVIPAKVTGDVWPTTDNGASYLLSSPIPGETGNSVIYGHNWMSLFGKIVDLKKGDEIDIQLADKTVRKFRVINTTEVSPSDTQILAPTDNRVLTLYTCSGFLDSKRYVVRADFAE